MRLRFIKASALKDLIARIEDNLEIYREGNFELLLNGSGGYFESEFEFNETVLSGISCESGKSNEVECCLAMYEAFSAMSQYLARDERIWVYLTHTLLLDYARTRWPIPQDPIEAVNHIKTHFFCIGARGVERDNAASRLWWMASLCNRVKDIPLVDTLTCFLYQSDVRANIIERPTTSQNVTVFSAILKRLHISYLDDKALLQRKRFRAVMTCLNLRGGVKLLGALSEVAIGQILDECIAQAS